MSTNDGKSSMKVLTILGSPRKRGHTANILRWLEEDLESGGHEVERVNVVDHKFYGCNECYQCQKPESGFECSQKDDSNLILGKMIDADSIVYAAPLFVYSFPGQMKLLIDQMFCLVKAFGTPNHTSAVEGKTFALLMTCEGPLEHNTEEVVQIYKRMTFMSRGVNAGHLIVPFSGTPGVPGDKDREKIREIAGALEGRQQTNVQ